MAIFFLRSTPIGRGSGRSAVGAAAYRAGEKLHCEYDGVTHDYTNRRGRSSVEAAAYRSGGRLQDGNTIHDYTIKRGIVHSEIMLPDHAPKEYYYRGILWNSVESFEKSKNARTAREVLVALPNELALEQQIELVRDYVKRNFVDKGMCADFSIHSGHRHTDKDEIEPHEPITPNNPHAHIMLTVRPINKDGTWGAKSKKEYILDNHGNKIKLKSGEWKSRKINATNWDDKESLLKWRENWALTVNKEFERLGIDERIDHRTLKAQGIDREPTIHIGVAATAMERRGIKTERGDRNREIIARNKARSIENTAKYIHELTEGHFILDKKITELTEIANEAKREMNSFRVKVEDITERAEHIHTIKERIAVLKTQRQDTRQLERSYTQATDFFKDKHQIAPEEAAVKIQELESNIKRKRHLQEKLNDKISSFAEEKEAFALKYQRQKLLAEINPDWQKIQDRLTELDKESQMQRQSVQDKLAWTRSKQTLDTVTEQNYQEILKELTPEQAQALIERREREREREKVMGFTRGR